jgi:hypothetical protein
LPWCTSWRDTVPTVERRSFVDGIARSGSSTRAIRDACAHRGAGDRRELSSVPPLSRRIAVRQHLR